MALRICIVTGNRYLLREVDEHIENQVIEEAQSAFEAWRWAADHFALTQQDYRQHVKLYNSNPRYRKLVDAHIREIDNMFD